VRLIFPGSPNIVKAVLLLLFHHKMICVKEKRDLRGLGSDTLSTNPAERFISSESWSLSGLTRRSNIGLGLKRRHRNPPIRIRVVRKRHYVLFLTVGGHRKISTGCAARYEVKMSSSRDIAITPFVLSKADYT